VVAWYVLRAGTGTVYEYEYLLKVGTSGYSYDYE
jgi:hypothetical protein